MENWVSLGEKEGHTNIWISVEQGILLEDKNLTNYYVEKHELNSEFYCHVFSDQIRNNVKNVQGFCKNW